MHNIFHPHLFVLFSKLSFFSPVGSIAVLVILFLSSSSCPPCLHQVLLILFTGFLVFLLILFLSSSLCPPRLHQVLPGFIWSSSQQAHVPHEQLNLSKCLTSCQSASQAVKVPHKLSKCLTSCHSAAQAVVLEYPLCTAIFACILHLETLHAILAYTKWGHGDHDVIQH